MFGTISNIGIISFLLLPHNDRILRISLLIPLCVECKSAQRILDGKRAALNGISNAGLGIAVIILIFLFIRKIDRAEEVAVRIRNQFIYRFVITRVTGDDSPAAEIISDSACNRKTCNFSADTRFTAFRVKLCKRELCRNIGRAVAAVAYVEVQPASFLEIRIQIRIVCHIDIFGYRICIVVHGLDGDPGVVGSVLPAAEDLADRICCRG